MSWQVGGYATEGEKPFDQGSFGTVWKARRIADNARVALKLVLLTDAPDARERIAAERHGAMLQQAFQQAHGMVPTVYDFGYDSDGHLYIAMELIEGGALSDLIKAGPVAPELAARYAVGICDFLDRAHSFATTVEGEPYDRLVHADLKPGHVLIGPSGDVKVLDFGIAKALARTTQVTTNNWGTSAYASPERLEDGHVNEHVDFWSLGVILYEMLAGHRPYPALEPNRSRLEHAIRTNAPREPLPYGRPAGLAAIVNKLLAYQVERRYASAAAIKGDLELFLDGRNPAAAAEYTTPATMPIGQRTESRLAVPPPLQEVPPTEPLPSPPSPPSPPAAASETPAATARRAPRQASGFRMLVHAAMWASVLLILISLIATEGVAWIAAERFRHSLDRVEGRSLAETMNDYQSIRARSVLGAGLRLRVDQPLRQRLVAIADHVIADYRLEEPTMGPAEWKQAQQSLRWAERLDPRDRSLRARLALCDAHVLRLSARGQPAASARVIYKRAIDRFRDAADLDDRSYDPYLVISRIAVYGLGDVDQAAEAIKQAEKRGYVSGRRERALLGDGYLRRAEVSRGTARNLSGEQRRRELEKARADYEGCIEAFDPILDFGYAAANIESCKAQLARIDEELAAIEPKDQGL
jgi:serine/threonine protein kinase